MPRRRQRVKGRVGGLVLDRERDDEWDLSMGPWREDAEELDRLRELYWAHREYLLSQERPGRRPWAFYVFELGLAGFPKFNSALRSTDQEADWLRKHGHLTRFEERALEEQQAAS